MHASNEIPGTGLEPARLAAPDPKSGVSANFTTPAYLILKDLRLKSCSRLARVILFVILTPAATPYNAMANP